MSYPFRLRVGSEDVGIAYGSTAWFRAQEFLRIPTLPGWITETAWTSLVEARRRLDADVPITDLAKGYSGNGMEE